jgi:DHA1 family tetracycline resistance protein-like MFS transporter
MAGMGVTSMVVSGLLVKPAVGRFGERRVLLAAFGFGIVGFSIYGLAPTTALAFVGVPLQALWGLAGPAMQGLMTRHVRPSEQGQLQGAQSSLQGIAGMIAPGLFTQVFAFSISPDRSWHLPGAPFLLAAAILTAALTTALRVTRPAAGRGTSA